MKNTAEIDGWFNYQDTFDVLINTIPYEGKFAECGAWLGKSSSYLCDTISKYRPDITPYIIDSWQASDDETEMLVVTKNIDVYQTFLNNMGNRKFEHIKALSVDACKQFPDNFFDVIFIDMCHLYDYVKQDIEAWYPKLKLNGYMAGHDFSRSDVNRAVYESFSYTIVSTAPGDCWIVQKTKENL
jgi:hypothetical protein